MDENAGLRNIADVPILLRREIEALMTGPLLEAFGRELGETRTMEIVSRVIAGLARKAGRDMAKACGGNDLVHFQKMLPMFGAGGALDLEIREMSAHRVRFDVTRCAYADMYRRNGLSALGSPLSCQRDVHLFAGFNPDIVFTRTQTLMDQGTCCDFCLTLQNAE